MENHVNKFLVTKLGFRRLEADPCIYKKTVKQEVKGAKKEQHALIALYADDSNKQMCKDLEKIFSDTYTRELQPSRAFETLSEGPMHGGGGAKTQGWLNEATTTVTTLS